MQNEVTDISQVKFEIEKPGETVNTATPKPSIETPKPESNIPGGGEKKETPPPPKPENVTSKGQENLNTNNSNKPNPEIPKTDTPPQPEEEEFVLETDEDFDHFLSEASEGKINSFAELDQKLNRLAEIEANPSILLKDDRQKKIFDYLNKYPGEDFGLGLQSFVKLQQMDINSLDPKAAIKELYIMNFTRQGLSKEDAEKAFDAEFEEKYETKGETGQIFLKRDSILAKSELQKMKDEALLPTVDSQPEENNDRKAYLSEVERSFNNDNGQFKELQISFSDNVEEDLTVPVENLEDVQHAMANYGEFFEQRYINPDKTWNTEQLKLDLAFLLNQEAILQKSFDHGVSVGEERKIRERTNTPDPKNPASNANQNGAPKSMQQAILDGMGKG
jgi:hypothetical protein